MEAETKCPRGRPRGSTGTTIEADPDEQIDQLIERRAKEKSEANQLEAMYAESVRRYHQRKESERRWSWIRFEERMAATHAALAEEHQQRAQELMQEVI